jgi:hypothetical protein
MVVEAGLVFGAAKAAAEAAQSVYGLIQDIRTGRFANNDEAKEKLEVAIAELQAHLRDAGALARHGEEYTGLQQDVVELLWECERLRASLRENNRAISQSTDPGYGPAWDGIAQMFDSVELRQAPLFRALDNRIEWLNDKDFGQIQDRLNDAALASQGAAQAVRSKASADAEMHVRRMIEELRRVQASLNDSLLKGIFGSLKELAR